MSYIKKREKLNWLLELISKGNCGDASCLARRLNVSERTIKTYISILRDLGNQIYYDPLNKTYSLFLTDHRPVDDGPLKESMLKMA